LEESVVAKTSRKWLRIALASLLLLAGFFESPSLAGQRGVYVTPVPGKEGGLLGPTKIYDRSYAVVIGINRYQKLPTLTAAVADAEEVAKVLENHGFEVALLRDGEATRDAIRILLGDSLRRKAETNDRVLVFFSGHGDRPDAMGYLMPVDGDYKSPVSTGISLKEMQDWFDTYRAKHVMFVADACYSGLALPVTKAAPLDPETKNYLKIITSRPVRLAMVAGGRDEEALEWRGKGLFTRYFLEALSGSADENRDGIIEAREIDGYVRPLVVMMASQQFRKTQVPHMGRDGEGEFAFLNPLGARLMLGSLKVASRPEGGRVLVNGQDTGVRTPGMVGDLKPGRYKVAVEKDGQRSTEIEVEINAGSESPVALALPYVIERVVGREGPRPLAQGRLVAKATRKETGEALVGEVWANGVKVGRTGNPLSLDPGVYNLEVRFQDKPLYKEQVRVASGGETTVKAFFSWPLEKPQVEQTYAPKSGMSAMAKGGWSLLGIGAAGIVAGGVMYKLAQDEIDAQASSGSGDQSAYDAYGASAYTGFAVGGAALATGAILLIVNATQKPAAAAYVPVLESDGKGLMASWRWSW